MAALHATIWISMLLFIAGESGRAFTRRGYDPPRWAWWAFATGLLLAIVHTGLAFATVHDWSHDVAVRVTAMQTQAVYGVPVGWGIYGNYLFFAVWFADAWWWKAAPAGFIRPRAATWTLRAFYFIIIFNAVVVFVDGARRLAGFALVSWLARAWSAVSNDSEGDTIKRRKHT
ncbi:MAG TPA: hypothetical protein VNJ03_02340 [Vicinamibacterales bacterium]|nr:hypothetical protein [Vicinamibacterales bacterium]